MSLDAPVVPQGWQVSPIGDLFSSFGGHTPPKANAAYWGGSIPWVSSRDIKDARLRSSTHTVTQQAVEDTGLKVCPAGSVLVVMRSGILAHSLPVTVTEIAVTINQDLKAFHSPAPHMNEWLALFLRTRADELLASSRRDGTTVQSIQYPLLKNTLLPFPDAPERRRLLDAAEVINGCRDAVQQQMATARQTLERFRQAVLAAACSGRLTADWRRDFGDANDELPLGWSLTTPTAICDEIVDCPHSTPRYGQGDYFALDTTCMTDGGILVDRLRPVTQETFDERNKRLVPTEGDVVFAREGTVGTAVVLPKAPQVCLGQRVMLLRPSNRVIPEFLSFALMSPQVRGQYADKILGTTVAHINVRDVKALELPLPPRAEQEEMMQRVMSLLASASGVARMIMAVEQSGAGAVQAALARAFESEGSANLAGL